MPAAAQASRDAWKADVAALRSEGRGQPSSRKDEIGSRYAFLAELKRLLNHQVSRSAVLGTRGRSIPCSIRQPARMQCVRGRSHRTVRVPSAALLRVQAESLNRDLEQLRHTEAWLVLKERQVGGLSVRTHGVLTGYSRGTHGAWLVLKERQVALRS